MCTSIDFSPSFNTGSILRVYCTSQLDDQGSAIILPLDLSLDRLETKVNRLTFLQDNRVTLTRMKKGNRITSHSNESNSGLFLIN
jgi:hypothetical protein